MLRYTPPCAWKTAYFASGFTPAWSSRTAGATPPQRTSSTLQPSTQWKSTVSALRSRPAQVARSTVSGDSTRPSTVTTHSSGGTSGTDSTLRTGNDPNWSATGPPTLSATSEGPPKARRPAITAATPGRERAAEDEHAAARVAHGAVRRTLGRRALSAGGPPAAASPRRRSRSSGRRRSSSRGLMLVRRSQPDYSHPETSHGPARRASPSPLPYAAAAASSAAAPHLRPAAPQGGLSPVRPSEREAPLSLVVRSHRGHGARGRLRAGKDLAGLAGRHGLHRLRLGRRLVDLVDGRAEVDAAGLLDRRRRWRRR